MIAITLPVLAGACADRAPAPPATPAIADARRHYRGNQDYRSLETLVAQLRLGMPKSEVEALLGGPGQCVIQSLHVPGSQCRHGSDRIRRGVEVQLEVEYTYFSPQADDAVYTGLLESYMVGPIPE